MRHDLDYYRKIQGMNDVSSRKEAEIRLIKSNLAHDFYNSIDCESASVNGTLTDLLITRSTDYNIKKVVTKPDEHVYLGDIIAWCDTDWIIDTIDADDRINTHAKMRRCNVVLKWLDENGVIRAYPGFCEDATKYGEGVEGGKMVQVPDFQVKVKIRLDQHSSKINRDRRFLLDAAQYLPQMESSGSHPSAFIVTRRNVLTGNHAGSGYVELTLNERVFSDRDNPTLMIANYYADDDVYELTIANADKSLTVAKGAEYVLSCTAKKNGERLDQTAIWFYTSDPSVATVNDDGVITAVGKGSCVVTAQVADSSKSISVEVVESVPQFEIRIEPDDGRFDLVYGDTKEIRYRVYYNLSPVPYSLSASIVDGASLARIENATDNSVLLVADGNKGNIGKTLTLEVHEEGYDLSAQATFEIVGWW